MNSTNQFAELQEKINYTFRDQHLLHVALTHRSYASEKNHISYDNERFEFLGDSIIGASVSIELFKRYPDYSEGKLTALKSFLVSKKFLAQLALEMQLGNYIFLGIGEEKTGGRDRNSLLGNTFEALIGAVFLDSSHETAHSAVWNLIEPKLDDLYKNVIEQNYKNILQSYTQKEFGAIPHYTIREKIDSHNKSYFFAHVGTGNMIFGTGKDTNKKRASFQAARSSVINLGLL
ncbi:MAG: ribonuclease III [bacterium]|nr:ribonuclease III [bacterium]